jgi:translation initiation factor IF-2
MESFQAGEKAAAARPGASAPSNPKSGSSNPASSGSRVARLGEETLRALSGGLPIGHSNVDGDDQSDAPTTTSDGEYRYEKKKQHIQRKKENFMRGKEPAAVKWTGSISDDISDGGDDHPAKPGEKRTSSSSSYDPAVAPSMVLDIAAMKKMYSGRLGQNNGASAQSGSISKSDSQSISWRLYPQLPGQKRKSSGAQKDDQQTFVEPAKKSNTGTVVREVVISDAGISIRELSSKLSKKTEEVKALLENLGEDLSSAEDSVVSHSARQKRMARRQQASAVDDKIIDADIAELVVLELGLIAKRERVERELPSTARRTYSATTASASNPSNTTEVASKNPPRAPIVCVMGHVDHGKTTLMDHLRSASVAAGEAGGITQKLSAFSVKIMGDKRAAFIDSPGHAAFSGMRTYGALATDIVILVVALDDGVRPQTIEAIKAAKDAKCAIVVALNKVDKIPAADRADAKRRVLSQLMDNEVVVEEYGGDVFCAEISGKTGQGVQALLEGLLLQAEVLELSAPTDGFAEATIIDARFEKGRGVVADCIVRWGKLSVGDPIFAGSAFGNVKSILDDTGKSIPFAGPSSAVQIIGLRSLPTAGQELLSTESEEKAKRITERRARVLELRKLYETPAEDENALSAGITVQSKAPSDAAAGALSQPIKVSAVETVGVAGRLSAEEAAIKMLEEQGAEVDRDALAAEEVLRKATLNVILKSDGAGTLEALKKIVASINSRTSDARIRVIHSAVGSVLKSDIELAAASANGSIFAFNVGLGDGSLKQLAKRSNVDVFKDSVIYRLEDELLVRLEALMPKERILTSQGTGKVLQLFPLNDKLKSVIAGMSVTSGTLVSGKDVVYRVKRGGKTVLEESVMGESGLRRFKDTVSQVTAGNECGLTLGSYKEFAVGDEIECFKVEWRVKTMKVQDDENNSSAGGYGNYVKGDKSKK